MMRGCDDVQHGGQRERNAPPSVPRVRPPGSRHPWCPLTSHLIDLLLFTRAETQPAVTQASPLTPPPPPQVSPHLYLLSPSSRSGSVKAASAAVTLWVPAPNSRDRSWGCGVGGVGVEGVWV
jgi:hypothetical protein